MKICAIFNIFPSYRKAIYKKMSSELPIDFFFGNISNENITLANSSELNTGAKTVRNIFRGKKLIWQKKAIRYAFSKKFTHYLLTGNTGIVSNWFILLIARVLRRRVILWTHGLYGNERGLKKFKNSLYLKLATDIFTYNERGRQILIDEGFKSNRISVIYNSLDFERQQSIIQKVGDQSFARNYFGNNNDMIAFIGRLTPQKKVDQLIEAVRISKKNYNVIIVGDGPCRVELEALTRDYHLEDRVWFYGECYDESMLATIITHSHLCVSPGNCGLNAIESLTYGTPMITHSNMNEQMPEAEAVIELCKLCDTNYMFEQNNINDLSATIDKSLSVGNNEAGAIAKDIISRKWNPNHQISIMVHYLR